jgi:hypothetical protein
MLFPDLSLKGKGGIKAEFWATGGRRFPGREFGNEIFNLKSTGGTPGPPRERFLQVN